MGGVGWWWSFVFSGRRGHTGWGEVTGVQACARRVGRGKGEEEGGWSSYGRREGADRKSGVEGKSVELGGRRLITTQSRQEERERWGTATEKSIHRVLARPTVCQYVATMRPLAVQVTHETHRCINDIE